MHILNSPNKLLPLMKQEFMLASLGMYKHAYIK